jgi:AraC family transcriptional regulator of adaptative response / DNA-3-methyladenine glycosylase II
VRAILGQQVSVKAATTMAGRLASAFGSPVPGGEGVQFPGAPTLSNADLTRIGLTRQRAASIRELAAAVGQGDVVFDGPFDAERFEKSITAIPGIGPWTAQYIAMRLGEPDAFPSGDLHLRHAGARSEAWRPWRAYAAMHLWKEAGGRK